MTELSELELTSQNWTMIDRIEPKDPTLEQSWAILGKRNSATLVGTLVDQFVGTPTQVEVFYEDLLAREEAKGDIAGFYHTHPTFKATPSDLDDKTMVSWVISLGKPLISVIQGTDGVFAQVYFTNGGKVVAEGPYPVSLIKSDSSTPRYLILVDFRKTLNCRKVEE